MLAPHGPALSVQLRRVRLRLREFLATQAAAGKSVPMQRTALGLHPTVRWTIRFGKWLATTRIIGRAEGEPVARDRAGRRAGGGADGAHGSRREHDLRRAAAHEEPRVARRRWGMMVVV